MQFIIHEDGFSLQGIEAAYLTSSHYLSKLAKDGWIPYQQSAWNYNTVRDTAKDWVNPFIHMLNIPSLQ